MAQEPRTNCRSLIEKLNEWSVFGRRCTLAIPMATAMPDFESMPVEELRRWSVIAICEADPRVLRATGTKDDFTNVLFIRIAWKPGAIRAKTHDPLLSVLERVLSRWARRDWLVVVTDQPSLPARRRAPPCGRRGSSTEGQPVPTPSRSGQLGFGRRPR